MFVAPAPYDAVVLGAGILGLATADALSTAGLRVAVLARDLPEDTDSAAFASPWAGANWSSFAANPAERRRDTLTFETLGRLAESHPSLVRRHKFVYVWNEDAGYSSPWYKDLVFDFRPLKPSELPPGFSGGVTFGSYTLNPPRLTAYLASRLRSRGVPIVRRRVASLSEAAVAFGRARLVVNATGLGAKTLLGVEDAKVHPVRGQTVLVRAPGITTCYGVRDKHMVPGEATYIIPRPGSDGCVIVGGTNLKDDYSTLPHPETAQRILQKAHKLCPELAPGGGSWEDIEVVSHNVGLRPSRDGGIRLEVEEVDLKADGLTPEAGRAAEGKVGVLHCYGIGPAGYQASFGVADEAKELALAYLAQNKAKL